MLHVGIVGCGNIFECGYLPVLPSVDSLRIGATCDLIGERADRAKERTGARVAVLDVGQLYARPEIDAVFILTPTDTHAELTIQALEAGKHVLCEKPMARTLADTQRMADAARRSGKRLMIGHTRRFDDRWRSMLEPVRGGRLGELSYIFRSEHSCNGAPPGAWQWRDTQSGGVLWDVGIHAAELFCWFFDALPDRVFARRLHVRPESQKHGGAPDGAVAQFSFGPQRHALLSVSWFHPPQWAPFYATMDLVGTEGKMTFFDRDMHALSVVDGGLTFPRYSPLLSSIATAFKQEITHFAHAVESGEPFTVTVGNAQAAVAAIEAAERSTHSGQLERVTQ